MHYYYGIKDVDHHARLKENGHLFPIELSLRENFFCCVRGRANLRALMTQKSCAVGMRYATLRNHLKEIVTGSPAAPRLSPSSFFPRLFSLSPTTETVTSRYLLFLRIFHHPFSCKSTSFYLG